MAGLRPGAGMNACARDLARFGLMLLDNGAYNGSQIVPAAWVEQTRDGTEELRRMFAETAYADSWPGARMTPVAVLAGCVHG